MTSPDDFRDNVLFRGVPDAVIEEAAGIPEPCEFEAGKVILREGAASDHFYLIAKGNVGVSKRGRGGRQETLSRLGAGDFFGEMGMYDPQPRSARVTAEGPCRLGRVDAAGWERLLGLAPVQISLNLTRCIIQRLRGANTHFIEELMEAERLSLVGSMASTIIHDFRNPISVIFLATDLLDERCLDQPEIQRATQLIRRSVARMLNMAQELLDYSRGVSELALSEVAVLELLAEVEEQGCRDLGERGIDLDKRVEARGSILVDRGRFVRALLNLVRNAVEAMPDGGTLTLAAEAHPDGTAFVIADTGVGIPEHVLARLFEPFVTHGKSGGTGLG
ncbi:MAG: cyclic nucleotide-binding domain-containing protein, partial [Longimicrobiaceae bacterium]